MKIGIDITRAIIENAGIGRFTREITQNLIRVGKTDDFVLLSTHFRESKEKNEHLKDFIAPNVKIKRLKLPGDFKELAWGWPYALYENIYNKSDILLAPSFFEVHLAYKTPQVVIIHDMATFLFPEQRGQEVSARHNKRVKKVCTKAKKIIAISESTKNDIIKFLKINPERIEIVGPGLTQFPEKGKLPSNLKSKSYILFVGTLEPRKNLKGLVQAYRLLSEDLREKYPLVIVGAKGWNTAFELEEIKETKGVNWLGYVSDADLGELYRQAAIFAYPSLYEGFGLPVIEAQQYGVPVLTSNISSLPEAVGDGGVQIDPLDINSIARGLQRLLEDKELAQSLGQKALEHAKKYSWEVSAQKILDILKEVKGE
ncbi:MAG: glycosyltransferase family 1 protein [Candidatus Berkelbacteria bacterium]